LTTKSPFRTLILFGLLAGFTAQAAEDSLITSVYASASDDYRRVKRADGSFEPEYYALSNGGYSPGIGRDPSIDEVPFPTLAGVVAQHLARQNYLLAPDSKSADLLILIQWGSTIPFDDAFHRNRVDQLAGAMNAMNNTKVAGPVARTPDGIQSDASSVAQASQSELGSELLMMEMANNMRDRANEKNARLLGYSGAINSVSDLRNSAGGSTHFSDLISDIENRRYYVIVTAYDFRSAMREKKKKFLWSTRVSIQAQGNRFDERVMTMMANAGRQFGQNNRHLIRQYQQAPKINLGELKILGIVPEATLDEAEPKQN
jgi:hypothetical protein